MMIVEIKIDESCKRPKAIIITNEVTEEIKKVIQKLTEVKPHAIAGFKDDLLELIDPIDIIRIYASKQKVYVQTPKGEYTVRQRLYELEDRLMNTNQFIRISQSEIINLKTIINMDLSFSGTICIRLVGNITTYVSRRYVTKLKQILGI